MEVTAQDFLAEKVVELTAELKESRATVVKLRKEKFDVEVLCLQLKDRLKEHAEGDKMLSILRAALGEIDDMRDYGPRDNY